MNNLDTSSYMVACLNVQYVGGVRVLSTLLPHILADGYPFCDLPHRSMNLVLAHPFGEAEHWQGFTFLLAQRIQYVAGG